MSPSSEISTEERMVHYWRLNAEEASAGDQESQELEPYVLVLCSNSV